MNAITEIPKQNELTTQVLVTLEHDSAGEIHPEEKVKEFHFEKESFADHTKWCEGCIGCWQG